ncbi:MAG: TrbG/VirB9 family P-type conjugative transfer protein [Sphingomicrobium sp.]
MIRKFSFVAFALLSCTAAVAATDNRIRSVAYDANQIVRIVGKAGIQSTIEFADDERIENVAVGDSSAWQITPNRRASLLFVKPLAAHSRTNMTVVTDRRTYMFDLVAGERSAAPIYAMKFSYPNEPKSEASNPAQQVAAATPQPSAVLTADKLHFDWKSKGHGKLVPRRMFDDGASVYLAWDKETPLPAILTQSQDRKEGPVNYRMSGEYIVISPVPANLVLRYGKKSALLWPTHPIAAPRRAIPAQVTGRIATAAVQPPQISQAVPPHPARAESKSAGTVKLANMTSLYSDKLTDTAHER